MGHVDESARKRQRVEGERAEDAAAAAAAAAANGEDGDNDEQGRPVPKPGRCQTFVKRKNRFCTHWAAEGGTLCHQHKPASDKYGKRVPCPVDPSHTVFESRLAKHLSKCSAVQARNTGEGQPYYSKGINAAAPVAEASGLAQGAVGSAGGAEAAEAAPASRLFEFGYAEQDALIARLDGLLERAGAVDDGTDPANKGRAELLIHDLEPAGAGGKIPRGPVAAARGAARHRAQEDSLIENTLGALGLESFPEGTCVVEMGAGRGGVSQRLCDAIPADREAFFVLVDRATARNNRAAAIRMHPKRRVSSLRIDIRDLDLWKVPLVRAFVERRERTGAPLAMVSKHLCGDATCYTLRCAAQAVKGGGEGRRPDAIVIALCCHHRCSREGYVNPGYVSDVLGLSPLEFDMLRRMCSWATCGAEHRTAQKEKEKAREAAGAGVAEDVAEPTGDGSAQAATAAAAAAAAAAAVTETGHAASAVGETGDLLPGAAAPGTGTPAGLVISDEERARIGLKCKLLLNYGRVLYLREHGFEASLVRFASKATTLENTLLVARPRPAQPAGAE